MPNQFNPIVKLANKSSKILWSTVFFVKIWIPGSLENLVDPWFTEKRDDRKKTTVDRICVVLQKG